MIYSKSNKVEQYLSHYNIKNISYNKNNWVARFTLTNLHTIKDYTLDISTPLYNILSKDSYQFKGAGNFYTGDESLLQKMMFDSTVTFEYFETNFLNTDYYKRFGVLEHEEGNKLSTVYFSYLEKKDIDKVLNLVGLVDNTIVDVYGNFFKLDDNTLRFMFRPQFPVLENVDKVFFAQSYIFTKTDVQYPMYFIIYTNIGSSDVMYELSNLLVNSVTNNGLVTVNLTQMFGNRLSTILSDMETLNGFNTNLFILPNIFTCAIFRNTSEGILRFIPITYTNNFFNLMFNNIKVNNSKVLYGGAVEGYPAFEDSNAVYDTISSNSPELTDHYKVSSILKSDKMVPLSDMKHVDFLDQLLKLSSTAEYYNDVLFSADDSTFQFPVYLISEYYVTEDDLSMFPYGNDLENVNVIDNVTP